MMIEEAVPSDCFRNNGLLCGFILAPSKLPNPIIEYNTDVATHVTGELKPLLLFQTYRLKASQPEKRISSQLRKMGECANTISR
jgi:hypothetical protein